LFNTWQGPPLGVLQLLEEQQQECHRMDAISVSPRNEWTEVDIEEVEEEGISCWVICHDTIIPCELSTCIRRGTAARSSAATYATGQNYLASSSLDQLRSIHVAELNWVSAQREQVAVSSNQYSQS